MSVMSLAIFSSTVHVLLICQHRSFQITPTIFRRSIEQSFKKLSFLSCSSSTVYISSRMDWSKPLYSTVQCAACWMDLGRLPWLKGLRNTGLSAVCVCVCYSWLYKAASVCLSCVSGEETWSFSSQSHQSQSLCQSKELILLSTLRQLIVSGTLLGLLCNVSMIYEDYHCHRFTDVIQDNLHCVNRHPRLKTGGFCWSNVLLPTYPYLMQVAYSVR